MLVTGDASIYHYVNQGCLTVETISDTEEMDLLDVCETERQVGAV